MKTAIIFHGYCYDGLTAAWVAWKKFRKTATYLPGFYGAPPPTFTEPTHIYILDFSFKPDVFDQWLSEGHRITILDHHQSAINMLQPYFEKNSENKNLEAVFDKERSGAVIAYQYFNPGRVLPRMVELVQDRDLWRFNFGKMSNHLYSYLNYSIELSDPIDQVFETLDTINESLEQPWKSSVMEIGEILSQYYQKFCLKLAERYAMVRIRDWHDGMPFPIVNINRMFSSDTCSNLMKELKTNVAGYFFLDNQDQWNWGMRSIGEYNVAELCSRYGGGGHVHAAGFIHKGGNPLPNGWEWVA